MSQPETSHAHADVVRGIARGELHLAYQPIVALGTGALANVEALLRWNHPRRGLLWPGDFLAELDDPAALVELGAWVFDESAKAAAHWGQRFPDQPLAVAVNVFGSHLCSGKLAEHVASALRSHHLEPWALAVEVDEQDLLTDVVAARTWLDPVRDLGVQIIADDFGRTYSAIVTSLAELPFATVDVGGALVDRLVTETDAGLLRSVDWLRDLGVNVVQIDRSFIARLYARETDAPLVRALVQRAHEAGLCVLAEGVQSGAEAEQLRTVGFDLAAGYHFHRPQTPEYVELLLEEQASGTAQRAVR